MAGLTNRRSQPPLALSVPLSRFTSRVGGGSAFYVRCHCVCSGKLTTPHTEFSDRFTSCQRMPCCRGGRQKVISEWSVLYLSLISETHPQHRLVWIHRALISPCPALRSCMREQPHFWPQIVLLTHSMACALGEQPSTWLRAYFPPPDYPMSMAWTIVCDYTQIESSCPRGFLRVRLAHLIFLIHPVRRRWADCVSLSTRSLTPFLGLALQSCSVSSGLGLPAICPPSPSSTARSSPSSRSCSGRSSPNAIGSGLTLLDP